MRDEKNRKKLKILLSKTLVVYFRKTQALVSTARSIRSIFVTMVIDFITMVTVDSVS